MDTYTIEELETFADFWVKSFMDRILCPTLNSFVDGFNAQFPLELPRDEARLGGGGGLFYYNGFNAKL
jgi:hypothetical protein